MINNTITKFEYVEYLPRDLNNMNNDGQHTIETKDENVFLLLKAVLEISRKFKLLQTPITISMMEYF